MVELDKFTAPPSLKDMALLVLKNAILADQLQTQKIYKIEDLAKSLNISKTPVREALLDLAARGFVTILPRRGIEINSLEAKDIRDLYEFRAAMEIAVIRHISSSIAEQSIGQVEAINITAKACMEKDDRIGYLKKDREFHLFLAEMTENDYLISALERVRDLVDWMGSKALVREQRMMEVFLEHAKIIQMLKKRDPEGAARMMEEHITITMENVLSQSVVS